MDNKSLDIGVVFSQIFSVFLSCFSQIVSILLVIFVPATLVMVALGALIVAASGGSDREAAVGIVVLLVLLMLAFLYPIAYSAVTYVAFQHLRGNSVFVRDALGVGASRAVSFFFVSFLANLAAMGGFLLFCFPAFIFHCMFLVGCPIAVVERKGILESLQKSNELTRGHKWNIFAVVFLVWIITATVQQMPQFLIMGTQGSSGGVLVAMLFLIALLGLVRSLVAICETVVYYELKKIKEGSNLENLTSVFD